MKILVSAYACSPSQGSEPGIGWGFVNLLAKRNIIYLITEKHEFENSIQNYLKEHPELGDRLKVFYVPRIRLKLLEKIWPPSYYWTYRIWQKKAFAIANELHRNIKFDLIHQLNMTGFREPGYLWKLDAPFVWGPIGGMGRVPWRFLFKMGLYGTIYFVFYNLINVFQMKFFIRPKLAARKAGSGLIAENSESQENILKYWGLESTVLCAVGSSRKRETKIKTRLLNEPFRIVWSGLHIPRKALNLALEAVAMLPAESQCELHVLGEGPSTNAWKRLAEELKIMGRCKFYGQLSREKALDIMRNAHVMLITSLKDDSSTVAVEALGLGLPIICLDHCGFADVVTEECGIKISIATPEESISGIILALKKLSRNERLRRTLAKGSLRRAKGYSWQAKEAVLGRIYRFKLSKDN